MAKKKKKKKMGPFFLCVFSLAMIIFTTYTVGKYWVTIYSKYKEKKELTKELASLKDKESELKADVEKLQDNNMKIEDEEVYDDNTIVITVNLD